MSKSLEDVQKRFNNRMKSRIKRSRHFRKVIARNPCTDTGATLYYLINDHKSLFELIK